MMFNAIDDDDFFTPTSSASNLAHLFSGGLNPPAPADPDASLMYTAPKQPKPDLPKHKPQNKVICVKTVQLYKLVDACYTTQGKHGLAIIGDTDLNSYELLLYRTKNNITGSAKVNASLTYTHHEDYSSFKDQQLNFWKVHFENAKDDQEFLSVVQSKGATVVKLEGLGKVEQEEGPAIEPGALSDGSQARADILVRISKVGQSMLPAVKNPDLSESEPDEIVKTKKVVRKPKRHSTSDKDTSHTTDIPEPISPPQYMVPMAASPMQPQYMMGAQYVPNQMVPCQMMSLADPLAVHFSENRTHNSEVRMNLSQLSNKLDSVLSKLNILRVTVPPTPSEPVALLHEKIEDVERKLQVKEERINQLLEDVDRLNLELEEFKEAEVKWKEELKSKEELSKTLEAEHCLRIKVLEDAKSELSSNVMNLQKTIDLQKGELEEKVSLEETVRVLRETVEQQESRLKEQQKKLKEGKDDDVKLFAEVVKDTMNTMYQNILERCGDENVDFRKVLSQNMKSTTFQIIQDYQKTWVRNDEEINEINPPPVPEFEVTV